MKHMRGASLHIHAREAPMQQSRAGGAASGSGCRVRARTWLAGRGVRHGLESGRAGACRKAFDSLRCNPNPSMKYSNPRLDIN